MRIVDLAVKGKGNCKAGNWSRTSDLRDDGTRRVVIFHYSTPMLKYVELNGSVQNVVCGLGHGSVSDQQGMNKLFNALGLPYYYQRKGGAQIR